MSGSGVLPKRRAFDTPEDVRREVILEKQQGYDFIKVHGDLPAATYQELLFTAKQNGIPVVGHVPPNLGAEATLSGGQVLITHAESFLDGYLEFNRKLASDPKELDEQIRSIANKTKQSGVWVQPTLSVFRQIISQVSDVDALLARPEMSYMPEKAISDWRPPNNPYVNRWRLSDIPKLRNDYMVLQKLTAGFYEAGVPLLAGSDDMVPCQLPGSSLADELEQLVEAGLSPYKALETATSNPARFLGEETDRGTITRGKHADLVLLSADPVANINNVRKIDGVMLNGHWFSEVELQRALSESKNGRSAY